MLIVAHGSPNPCCRSPSFDLNIGTVPIRVPRAGEVWIVGHQRLLACSQGCLITIGNASSRPHAAAQNNWFLRTGRRWRGSPGPARPDRWRQESTRIGSTAAPAPPKPRAILKDRNHSGLLPLQSFMAAEALRLRSADRGTGVKIQIVLPDRGDVPIDPRQSA